MTDQASSADRRYCEWFHDLDAWTEFWDVYHPETRGRYYFGDGENEQGLLGRFLPRDGWPQPFVTWTRMALGSGSHAAFADAVRAPDVAPAIVEVDDLVARLFAKHFGRADDEGVRTDYLDAMFRCGANILPPATERDALIADTDWRKRTAGRHMIYGDTMWFAWALQLEAATILRGRDPDHARRTLQLAGVAVGCSADFAWRGHRRTRPEYRADDATAALLHQRGSAWARNFAEGASEVHALFRLREWGHA